MKKSQRGRERVPASAKAQVSWTDRDGVQRVSIGLVVDISESGAKLELNERVPTRSFITFRAAELGLHGTASVRYCITHKLKYRVGLEFSGGLRWEHTPSAARS